MSYNYRNNRVKLSASMIRNDSSRFGAVATQPAEVTTPSSPSTLGTQNNKPPVSVSDGGLSPRPGARRNRPAQDDPRLSYHHPYVCEDRQGCSTPPQRYGHSVLRKDGGLENSVDRLGVPIIPLLSRFGACRTDGTHLVRCFHTEYLKDLWCMEK